MSTTTAARPVDAEPILEDDDEPIKFGETVALHDVDWEGYETLLKLVGDRHVRVTYLEGCVELMSPSYRHEKPVERFGMFVVALTKILEIPCESVGSLTFKRRKMNKGFEGDKSYYIANIDRIRGKTEIDPAVDPPPDLVVEVEVSSRLRDKLSLYAAVGVPELWRFDGRTFQILRLEPDGTYSKTETSVAFPFLRAEEIREWVARESPFEISAWLAELEHWLETVIVPRVDRERNAGT